jgi:ATP-binding cassette subfamily B protein
MDYELLDSPKVNDIRTRIRSDNDWGAGFYSMIWMLPWLLSSVVGLIVSLIILIPLFWNGSVFTGVMAFALLGCYVTVIIGNGIFTSVNKKQSAQFLDKFSGEKSFFSYFLWGGMDYKPGKDIRIYDSKSLIKGYIDSDPPIDDYIYPATRYQALGGFAGGLSSGLLMTLSYLFVVLRAIDGALSVGSMLKYAATIYQFSSQLNSVIVAFAEYSIAAGRQQSTLEYMAVPDALYKGSLPVEKRNDNEYEIEFRNVSFIYPGTDSFALKNLNLKLSIGQRMAVVGMNGSGKTTLIKLLCRLYDPTDGEITLNGIDIRKYRYNEYMSLFSVVFQDFKLFSFTLAQNVATSVEADRQRATDCLHQAGLSERLAAMPNGLDSPLYKDFKEDGIEISGGEAQKIALARALYKNAPFIVLDEPTAALDPIAEFEIYSKFNEIVGDKTAIFISHRLSSCRFCDDIVVFQEGEVIQRGNHEALIKETEGKYVELWNAQAQYYNEKTG